MAGQFRKATGDSAETAEIAMLCETIRQAFEPYVAEHDDPRHPMAMLMTALPMYAGSLFAALVFAGEIDPKALARMAQACAHNFREGHKVGLRRAARVAQETGAFGATQ